MNLLSGDMGVGSALLVAFFAGCGNVLITNPIWVVATRMQAHQKENKDDDKADAGPFTVAQEVWDESGIKVRFLTIFHPFYFLSLLPLFSKTHLWANQQILMP